jgi:serine/threonine protein kinase
VVERQFGPYRLVRQIAVGGMAEIHLAKTKGIAGFEKYVALKMIHPNFAEDEQFIQMLVDEAKIAVQLNHGNIAQTFDLGRVGDTFYITMEYVDGADLYKILRRSSEIDFELPLDVCAFIAKDIAAALDHAHRKRDHTGKTLGIVHRDVSPQNVLISYSGEIKLVDFGIAKATMKARQTAVGVIKGKYYYMSPEQAWGEQIDHRSDIFSTGIVLYEMLTGQMLYLEEDLHKLLDMVRKASIAPPSTLRKGIPPQLERIVMHALEKDRRSRYQSAADFATDLERFLHTYSPVFTASKVAAIMRQVVGDPQEVPYDDIEMRDGPMATHTLTADDLILDKDELRDANSVIFRIEDLKAADDRTADDKPMDVPTAPQRKLTGSPQGRVTRHAEIDPAPQRSRAAARSGEAGSVEDLSQSAPLPSVTRKPPTPAAGSPLRAPSKPRAANEETRQVASPAPAGPAEDSGLLDLKTPPPPAQPVWHKRAESDEATIASGADLDGISERTMVTGAPPGFGGFMMDAGDEGGDATVVSSGPPTADEQDDDEDHETLLGARPPTEDEPATMQRDFREAANPKASKRRPAPPALAAKIHAPAVSEIRKPKPSRKTPQGGVPAANVLQAIVSAQPAAVMPSPRPSPQASPSPPPPAPPPSDSSRSEDSGMATIPQQPSPVAGRYAPGSAPPPGQPYSGYAADASGLPITTPVGAPPGQPYPQQPYPAYPPQPYGYGYPQPPGYPQAHGNPPPQVSPQALYPLQPYGARPPQPMTLTGQLRLFEADEIPDKYKVSAGPPKWIKLAIAGVLAVSVAAGVTFFIIKATRDKPPVVGSILVESVPPGAEVIFDGTRLAGTTPRTIPSVPISTRHEIKVQKARYQPYVEMVDIPRDGGQVRVSARLSPIVGKLRVVTQPDGAEIWVDGTSRGRAPMTIDGLDIATAKRLELRLQDYQPYVQDLVWPDNGQITIDRKLVR